MRNALIAAVVLLAACGCAAKRGPAATRPAATRPDASPIVRPWQPEVAAELGSKRDSRQRLTADEWTTLGDHHLRASAGEEAEACYQRALLLDPDHVRANLGYGEWCLLHRKFPEAVTHLKRVVRAERKGSPFREHAEAVLEFTRRQMTQAKDRR